jgi:hypothetical protein
MSDALVPDDFRALAEPLTTELTVRGAVVPIALAVESVDPLPVHRLRAAPFSLILSGPGEPVLPQATYVVLHPRLGRIEIFLVPISRDAKGARYEVTFN